MTHQALSGYPDNWRLSGALKPACAKGEFSTVPDKSEFFLFIRSLTRIFQQNQWHNTAPDKRINPDKCNFIRVAVDRRLTRINRITLFRSYPGIRSAIRAGHPGVSA